MTSSKIKALKDLKHDIIRLKKLGKKIVFTNGCFDIIHAGHVHYLYQAKQHGDLLVVGINSDQSVKKLKGETRPVHHQMARANVLAALEMIDMITIFEEETPIQLIESIQPDVHVKGGDYKGPDLPEYQSIINYGGQVIIEPFLAGYSTTSIIEKIQQ